MGRGLIRFTLATTAAAGFCYAQSGPSETKQIEVAKPSPLKMGVQKPRPTLSDVELMIEVTAPKVAVSPAEARAPHHRHPTQIRRP